jgi:hypothetical protein
MRPLAAILLLLVPLLFAAPLAAALPNPCGVANCIILWEGACVAGQAPCGPSDLACFTIAKNPFACARASGPDALACAWVAGRDVACVPDPCPPAVRCWALP